ncbi:MAG TPA: transcription antitermination factor NusB [Actinomycetota bacterium]|nr:transcription antitermination factor NusB [Actinomycetota bacterium]
MTLSARALALDAIGRVIDEGAYSNRLLPAALARSGLDRRDRAFATELTYGVLRARLRLDPAIEARASRPLARMDARVAHLLRLGAYQLLEAGIAPHAAVGETVALADGRSRGFVNAVLRRIADRPPPPPVGEDDGAIEGRTGLTRWAVRELRSVLGDATEDAALALARRAPLCLRATGDVDGLRSRLEAAGHEVAPAAVDPSCVLLPGGADPTELPGYAEGAFAIQDQASAFVARTLGAVAGDLVADVCAAPGGKAFALAATVDPDGTGRGRVIAGDVRARRLAAMRREAARLGAAPVRVQLDARRPPLRPGSVDRVLVDAPCSGIGSARRRPELLWRVQASAVPTLASTQLAIATAAADLVRPGGRFVYAVCTFPRAETEAVADLLAERRPDLRPVATDGPDGPAERHRLWPHEDGADGMFVAAFERAS